MAIYQFINKPAVIISVCALLSWACTGCSNKDKDAAYLDPTFLQIAVSGAVSGDSIVAAGSLVQYGTYSVKNSVYTWVLPSDAEITQGNGTNRITVQFGLDSGMVRVSAGELSGKVVTKVNFKVTGPATATIAQTVSYLSTATLMTGVTYQWTVPSDAQIISGQGTNKINVVFSAQGSRTVSCVASKAAVTRTAGITVSVQ